MNSGAEAVESAIKVARKWAYQVKGVPDGTAEIVVAGSNFHGRTTTIVSFSTDPVARGGFGPFTPGFTVVTYGDAAALADAITDRTAAVLVEPIQGEAGVVVPPPGYLREVRRLCDERGCPARSRTRSSPVWPAPAICWRWTTKACVPTCTRWARRWAAASCRCPPWSARARCWACCGRASTARRSAATRWPAPSAGP